MKKQIFIKILLFIIAFFIGAIMQKYGVLNMEKTEYIKTLEPLFLRSEGKSEYFHILPSGTALYKYHEFPEGHTTYMVYINIKGEFKSKSITSDKPNLVYPIWADTIQPEQISKLLSNTPISKDDLVDILKARKMTRNELAQIVREWKD